MSVMDILRPYVDRPTDTQQDFDEVSRQVPADALGQGLADAFRSDRTPDFGSMVGSLFGGSNAQQRAGLLGQLISAVGPAVLSSLGGGAIGRMLKGRASEVSPEDAAQLDPDQVREIASAAEKQDPGIMDRVGAYYAQHPEVVKVLGGSALAILLGQLANRVNR
jgi:hypothetical protein